MFARFRTLTCALGVVAAVFSCVGEASAARARAKIVGDRVVTSDNGPLRGAPFFTDNWSTDAFNQDPSAYEAEFKKVATDFGMNVVRICPYMGTYNIDLKADAAYRARYTQMVKTTVQWAEEANIYAIINCHNQSGGWGYTAVRNFWEVMLDPNQNGGVDYANKTHVIFELTNEPDPQVAKADYQKLYDFVRSKAPNSMILLGSHVGPTKDGFAPSDLDALNVDWTKTAYAYHCYEGAFDPVGSTPSDKVWTQQSPLFEDYSSAKNPNGFPVICTETVALTRANDLPIDYSILSKTLRQAEDAGVGWMVWAPRFNFQGLGNPSPQFNFAPSDIAFRQAFTNAMTSVGLSVSTFKNQSGNGASAPPPPGGSGNVSYPINRDAWTAVDLQGCSASVGYGITSFDAWVFPGETQREDQFRFAEIDFGANGWNDLAMEYATASGPLRVYVWHAGDASNNYAWTYLGEIYGPGTGGWNTFKYTGLRLNRFVTGKRRLIFRAVQNGANIRKFQFKRS